MKYQVGQVRQITSRNMDGSTIWWWRDEDEIEIGEKIILGEYTRDYIKGPCYWIFRKNGKKDEVCVPFLEQCTKLV